MIPEYLGPPLSFTNCDCQEGYHNTAPVGVDCNCQPNQTAVIDANPTGTGLVTVPATGTPATTNPFAALTSNPTIMYLGLGLVAYLLLKK